MRHTDVRSFFVFSRRYGATEGDSKLAVDDSGNAIFHQIFAPHRLQQARPQILVQMNRAVDDQRSNLVLMYLRDSVALWLRDSVAP